MIQAQTRDKILKQRCSAAADGAVVVVYDDYWPDPDYPHQYWCQGVNLVNSGQADDHFGVALAALPSAGALPHRGFLPLVFRPD